MEWAISEITRVPRRARVIVLGNLKGGTGKSTTAMHFVVGLLREGFRVGTIDLDVQQGTLTRYVENRRVFAERRGIALPQPVHQSIASSGLPDITSKPPGLKPGGKLAEERLRFEMALGALDAQCDVVVIDTPGGETDLSSLAHTYADTLVTPLNDSFIDLDVLARIDPDTYKVLRPSRYSATVWEIRKERARRDRQSIDWVVLRNRLSHVNAHNKRAMGDALEALSARIGFRLAPGLSERVIYRELFLNGLTLLDLRDQKIGTKLSMSHVAARCELRDLLKAIGFVAAGPAAVPVMSAEPASRGTPVV